MKSPTEHRPYAEATKRLLDLKQELRAKEVKRDELRGFLYARQADSRSPAEKLAAGEAVTVASAAATEDEIATLTAQIRVLLQAIPLVEQRVSQAHSEASRLACAAVAGKHAEAVKGVLAAVVALAKANAAEAAVRRDIEAAGFSVYLRPMGFAYAGTLEENTGAAIYLLDALEQGYLTREEFTKISGGTIPLPAPKLTRAELAASAAKAALQRISGWAKVVMKRSYASPEMTAAEREIVLLREAKASALISAGFAEPSDMTPTPDEIREKEGAA